jgi:hypothetical protein
MNVISLNRICYKFFHTVFNGFSRLITAPDNIAHSSHTPHFGPNTTGLDFLSRFLTGPASIESSLVPAITTALSLTEWCDLNLSLCGATNFFSHYQCVKGVNFNDGCAYQLLYI